MVSQATSNFAQAEATLKMLYMTPIIGPNDWLGWIRSVSLISKSSRWPSVDKYE